ncbi:DUF397 domain-containing protein [Streptomyces canus]|uniref:DUF397 domain-containing protein n=1 Tax=Streptomyces canus TaxID=58343 RepID=UPI00382373C9
MFAVRSAGGLCGCVRRRYGFAGIRRHLRGVDSRVEEVGVVDGGPSESAWRISTHSLSGDTCVGVAVVSGGVWVRDTKHPTGSALIRLGRSPWQLFLVGLRSRPLQQRRADVTDLGGERDVERHRTPEDTPN